MARLLRNRALEPNFRPQPGDVIVRDMTPAMLAQYGEFLSVMGIIHIYDDENFFMYQDGDVHRVWFQFRSYDLILRFGRFETSLNAWQFSGHANLYLRYADLWFKVASTDGVETAYQANPDPRRGQYLGFQGAHLIGHIAGSEFRLSKGDFLIHQDLAVAPDRPWNRTYELRVVRESEPLQDNDRPFWGATDICVRIRMANPISVEEARRVVESLKTAVVFPILPVPMLVSGYACVGLEFREGGAGPPVQGVVPPNIESYPAGVWRYLGFDKHVFANLHSILSRFQPRRFTGIPTRPGDILINLNEIINPHGPGPVPGANPSPTAHTGGHILIGRNAMGNENRPEDRPGTMIIRVGYFETQANAPCSRYETGPVFDRTPILKSTHKERDDYGSWALLETPVLFVHNPLEDGQGWYESVLAERSTLQPTNNPLPLNVGYGPAANLGNVNQRLNFAARATQVNITTRDLILTKATLPRFERHILDVIPRGLNHRQGFQTPVYSETLQHPDHGFSNYSLFYYDANYVFRDGDHIVQFNVQVHPGAGPGNPNQWFCTAQLLRYTRTPPGGPPQYVYRGGDHVLLPVGDDPPDGVRRLDFDFP